jgi:glycosyltransferase involved in cell wall biosynthesis
VTRLAVAVDATPLLGARTGVGAFCAGLLDALARRDDVAVSAFAVSWRRRHLVADAVPAGVRAVRRPLPARPVQVAWRHSGFPPIELATGTVDVVHGTNFVVPPARRAARVVTVHDLTCVRYPELCEPASLRFPELVRRAVRGGAFVHTPSRFVAQEVVEHFAVEPDRVRVVLEGVAPASVTAGAIEVDSGAAGDDHLARLGLPPGPYVLALGTVEPRKDYPTLVAAFGELAVGRPELQLVVAGREGWGEDAFDVAVRECAAPARVHRLGYVDDTTRAELLAGAALLCYPSLYEGFGFPPLEAMAAGVPVVATAAGAVPEVVGDGALLVPPGDVTALTEAIATVLDDAGTRDRLRSAGTRRTGELTWDRCAAGLVELYTLAADERGPRRRDGSPAGSRSAS